MSDIQHLLYSLKEYRRNFIDQLEHTMDLGTRRDLAETQLAIMAVEAVIAEPQPERTGPAVKFGTDGYPKG